MPFPLTRPIHPDWEDYAQPTVDGTKRTTALITHPGTPGDWTPEEGATPGGPPIVVYSGPARVTFLHRSGAGVGAAGGAGQSVAEVDYRVAVPPGASPVLGDTLTTPLLPGAQLTVRRVGYGTETAEVYLYCVKDD